MRGIILAGGYGTRLAPFTNVSNKHLAPVYLSDGPSTDGGPKRPAAVPMIYYPIKTLKDSGVTEILIISSRDHCGHIIETLGDGQDLGVDLTYRVQEMDRKPTGIAQALKLAEQFVKDEPFAVLLGDNFYQDVFKKEFEDFETMCNDLKKELHVDHINHASIFLKEVHDPERFGVATMREDGRVLDIEEKPQTAKSNLAVTGLYLYTPQVFSILPKLKPSKRGELEITDVNNYYVKMQTMHSEVLNGFWHDMGTPESMLHVQKFLNYN